VCRTDQGHEALALEIRHHGVVGGVAHGQQQEGALIVGALEDPRQELHGTRRVRQRHEPRQVNSGDEHARRDADGLVDVVHLVRRAGRVVVLHHLEDDDQPGGRLQERLVLIGADGSEVAQPGVACAPFVELTLLRFGGLADLPLDVRILDRDEPPRLLVGPAGGRARRSDEVLDRLTAHRAVGEGADRSAAVQNLPEAAGRRLR
jgi:hypothetical protein